jgi:hypothetical protein
LKNWFFDKLISQPSQWLEIGKNQTTPHLILFSKGVDNMSSTPYATKKKSGGRVKTK